MHKITNVIKILINPVSAAGDIKGPDPDLSMLGGRGGSNRARGRLGPLWVQGKALTRDEGAKPPPPDGKRFSVFEMQLERSPL